MAIEKILLADDHPVSRKGLIALLKSEWPRIEVVEAIHGSEAVEKYPTTKPDVTILDYRMPHLNGYETSKEILRKDRSAKILLLTMFDSSPIAMNFLQIGGKGFITKDAHVDQILAAIRAVEKGDHYFHSRYEDEIIEWMQTGMKKRAPVISLSPRELEVCLKLSKGFTAQAIADELTISVRTVETYRRHVMEKTNVKNTAEMIEYIYKNGVV